MGLLHFLSDCYGSRASEKYRTQYRVFYYLLERGDQVIADRGFQIKEKLLLHFCSFEVPPGTRIKSQMMWLSFESMLKVQLIVSYVLEY